MFRLDEQTQMVATMVRQWCQAQLGRDRRLSLRAEMKLPGEALLEFEVRPAGEGGTRLTQTARFLPRGLLGLA